MELAYIHHPATTPSEKPPLLIVHGLFGSARNWNAIGKALASIRDVYLVDQRNHGDSGWDDDNSYPAMADDLAAFIRKHAGSGGQMDVLGHSMGGKAAMLLALQEPQLVHRLIVADIAPVTYSHSHAPYIEVMKRVDLATISRRSQAEPVLREGIEDRALRTFLLQSMAIDNGVARWKLNLEALGRDMPKIIGWPDDEYSAFEGRVLFLTGLASPYVLPKHREKILSLFPLAQHTGLKDAGHWLHADKPAEFIGAVEIFLG